MMLVQCPVDAMNPDISEVLNTDPFIHLIVTAEQDSPALKRLWPENLPVFQIQAACRYEYRRLQQAQAAQVPGVRQLSDQSQILLYQTRLKLSLSQIRPDQLTIKDKLKVAIAITEALASLHQQDIFHFALRPGVFLISETFDYAEIIDLSSARHCPKNILGLNATRPLFSDPDYLSPEQSYPTDRQADNRTDLYSLGCVLNWLFAGHAPFSHLNGEREIAYGHIAGNPGLPELEHPCIHLPLTELLQLLLAKEADNRYQSCAGVLHDLKMMLNACQSGHPMLALERRDISDRLHIPQKLYGRQQETRLLMDAFDRVYDGPSEAILIGGYSGVGKSALVHEIHKPILKANGLFISGKFDQYRRGTPYSALVQAFNHFISYLLALPDQQVLLWKKRLNDALAPNAQVLIDLLPELGKLLGPQPPLPALGADEQQNRFNRTFMQFVHEICLSHKPLVMFIDDLQWADLASIRLLHLLLADKENKHCLILGAYRDNEVDERHPFIRMLSELDNSSRIRQLELRPLKRHVIAQLIADSVQQPLDSVQALTELVFRKTGGNPFFFRQFMQELYQRELLNFDYQTSSWRWSVSDIDQQGITDNVVELMIARIERLPEQQQLLLQQAACIGAQFPVRILSQLNRWDTEHLLNQLRPVFTHGLLVPIRTRSTEADTELVQARFLHDRVQQAAYSRWSEQNRLQTHLQLGRLLLSSLDTSVQEDECFNLVSHFNKVLNLLDDAEIPEVMQLNFRSALKARSATAYATASGYINRVLELSDRTATEEDFLTSVYLEKLECLYLAGEYEQAESLKPGVQERCQTPALRTRFYSILITQYTRYGNLSEAIEQGLQALDALNWPMPHKPTMEDIGTAIAEAQASLAEQPFARLADKPATEKSDVLLTLDILMAMQPCCYNSGSLLFPLTILGLLKLTMQHGNSPYSSYVYMMYGLMCTKVLKDYDTAFEAARYSSVIARDYPANPLLEGRLLMMRANFILPWQKALSVSAQVRDDAYHQCLDQGDYYWGIHSYIFGFYSDLLSAPSLDKLLQRTEQVVQTCLPIKQPAQVYLAQLQCNLLKIIQGTLDNQHNLDHQPGYEQEALEHFQQTGYVYGKYDRLLGRLLQGYLQGNYQQALSVSLSQDLTPDDLDEGTFHEAAYTLFNLLCLLALQLRGESPDARQQQWQQEALARYQRWHKLNPDNFAAGYWLLEAEQAALKNNSIEARCAYERACAHAAQSGQALVQAIACERFARFCFRQDDLSLTRAWLEKAMKIYQDWGAYAKADDMSSLLTQISDQHLLSGTNNLDWQSVLSASQDISRQCSVSELVSRFLQRATTATGARQVAFFCHETVSDEQTPPWKLLALYQEGKEVRLKDQPVMMPESILNYCLNSRKALVLKDAANIGDYMLEQDIQLRQVRSVLALPLMVQEQFIGVLYLEHDATSHLFSAQKVKVMELLAGQFAITWLNACYYDQLQQYNEQLEHTVAERTHQLNKKNQHLEAILQALPIPFIVTSADGRLIEGNERLYRLFELNNKRLPDLNARHFYVHEADREELLRQLEQQDMVNDFECELKTASGKTFWAQFSVTSIDLDSGKALFSAISDISDRKQKEDILQQQASTDPLTGALNRRAFTELAAGEQNRTAGICVAMLDLDHFKALNDTYGHASGDEVLKQFVSNLQGSLREGDLLGRIGGEEFALILHQVSLEQGKTILDRICLHTEALTVDSPCGTIHVTTSGGVVSWQAGESLEQALERADQLLYQAKREGRNRIISSE